ncbi:hypothetical protein SLAV_37785 [Streptomyces lavendulae subsp. lavendulae]|uniref:Uncharacterized protein n=1 Tax=Streptomyces lavendulae subsp. lavendulae TaxID=58340 RepID=A0A2K8PRF1_STRLA|nr:hypothetical protein [Streptomyces lavendulae]ATZ29321.1 hypothetical protein SLAV_37785 [Streptomyces lavendulae subsp. lavendulae]QUQ59133.1 hypothetical protein SLLC_35935 [Streptomyces lavendulae subsp. lavendulae]
MYCLQAVIATEPVLRELAGSTTEACIIPLGQHPWLLPLTDALFDAVTVAGAPELDGFWKAPAGFDRLLSACSKAAPVAYVEADYFGGAGTQTAQVWDAGKVVLGPLHLADGEPSPTGTPISQALRRLGVTKGNHVDEFAAVGLGHHRDTDDWLSPTNRSRPDEHTI